MSKKRNKNAPKPMSEKGLWTHVSDTVDPLVGREIAYSEFLDNLPDMEEVWSKPAPAQKPRIRTPGATAVVPPKIVSSPIKLLEHGKSAGLDKRQAERLKKGRLAVEAKLDLHGLTQQEAHRALNAFIEGQWSVGRRCVLVVTGKGKGILQAAVPQWLNHPSLRLRILSFTYAQQKDGGTGALYILLKRHRLAPL